MKDTPPRIIATPDVQEICLNNAHYPMPEPVNELTADPRLHWAIDTPCFSGDALVPYVCCFGHITRREQGRAYVVCAELVYARNTTVLVACRRHAKREQR